MRLFREPEESDFGKDVLTFALGAAGGLLIGMLLSRRTPAPRVGRLGSELRERARAAGDRARTVARRLRPARLRRVEGEQTELMGLEDQVIDAFLADELLSERGIDVGAISPGIIELSGSVWTEEEAHRAVRLANGVEGVDTVVNRMEVEDEIRHLSSARRRLENDVSGLSTVHHTLGKTGGMGSRRQGRETDPDRTDDSNQRGLRALEEADLDQYEDEGLATGSSRPKNDARPEVQRAQRTSFKEDQLDNQDPHGKNAAFTLDEQPQELNSSARVGEGLKPGTKLQLEDSSAASPLPGGKDKKS